MNFTVGGLFGYCSSKVKQSLNVPSSNGVSAAGCHDQTERVELKDSWGSLPGPNITAFQSMMLSAHGAPDIP